MTRRTRILLVALALAVPVAAVAVMMRDRGTPSPCRVDGTDGGSTAPADSTACAPAGEPPCLASRIGLPCRE